MPRGKESIQKEGYDMLFGMLKLGESKHEAKKEGTLDGIYSYSTFRAYVKHSTLFLKWSSKTHGCKTVEEARDYVDEWLQDYCGEMSPHTIKLKAAAIAKMYGCSTWDFKPTLPRRRQDIKRSREPAVRDKHFSTTRNADFIHFCQATGLRRHEIHQVTADSLVYVNGAAHLHVKGKGGRWRDAPIIGSRADDVVARVLAAGNAPVWPHTPTNADIHSYRREYAQAIYAMYARDMVTLQRSERYDCRGDLAGVHYDRATMQIASRALGHNRISVIAGHYLG